MENARKKGDGGETDLVLLDVIKPHPIIKDRKVFTLPRYLPNPDKNKPYTFILLGEMYRNKLDFYKGIAADARLVQYIRDFMKLDPQKPIARLRYYMDYLEDANQTIAEDAYTELLRAAAAERHEVARTLSAAKVWTWLRDPKSEPRRSL